MGTRSLIAVKENDQYLTIYCHSDGDLLLHPLKSFHNGYDLAMALIRLGDLTQLHHKTGKTKSFYQDLGRDWEDHEPRSYNREELHQAITDCWAEYVYIFKENQWHHYTVPW